MTFIAVTRASLGAAFALALAAGPAFADPSPAAIGYAQTILIDIGMKPSIDLILPSMFSELEHDVLTTHPELKEPVRAALDVLSPEFVAQEKQLIGETAMFLANQMSEQDLKDTAAFYESPVGKKYILAQGATAGKVASLTGAWREKLGSDLVERLREELKKKGYSF